MYYAWPREDAAYQVPNEYLFGNQLIAAPITSPMSPQLRLAGVDAWLPDGLYHDLFTGILYRGGGEAPVQAAESIPVLARAGGIVPLMPVEEKAQSLKPWRSLSLQGRMARWISTRTMGRRSAMPQATIC